MGDAFAKLSMLQFTCFDMRVAKEAEAMEERDGGKSLFLCCLLLKHWINVAFYMLGLEYDRNMSTRLAKAYFRVASVMGLAAGL